MSWPWRRFDRMFLIHLARREAEKLLHAADMMRAAINANPNYDGKEGSPVKRERLQQIDEACREAVRSLRGRASRPSEPLPPSPVEDPNTDDPLFAAMHRSMGVITKPRMPEAGMGQQLLERE
jgi:hypothetical protein